MRHLLIAALVCGVSASPAFAQQPRWIAGIFATGKASNGFYTQVGGLPPGSGISAGPGYRHQLFGGRALIDGSGSISWSRATLAQMTFELPGAVSRHMNVGAQVARQDFTHLSYFGVGPASLEADRTDYRLTDTDYAAFATVRPRSALTLGSRFGYLQPLDNRPAFIHGDVYLDVDTRNHPSRPTNGGDYRLTLSTFTDRDFGRYSFRRIEGEATRFVPILHENWVIALRGRVVGSATSDGDEVPFYLLPTLGGSRSLRGYADYRFRDRNLLLLDAEYRWRVFGALDGALFYDAGNVAPRFSDLDSTDLKSSYGLGFRFHSNNASVFRVDIARSTEGTRLLLSLTEPFTPGHGSIVVPYVP